MKPSSDIATGGPDTGGTSAPVGTMCSSCYEAHFTPMLRFVQQLQEQHTAQLNDLRDMLDRKADRIQVPTVAMFQELEAKIAAHADGREADTIKVPTMAMFQELEAKIAAHADGKKAENSQVPTMAMFQELEAKIVAHADGRKADNIHAPTMAMFQELEAKLVAHTEDWKANTSTGVATLVRLSEVEAGLKRKADAGSMSSVERIRKLESSMEHKASAKDVATKAELAELEILVDQLRLLGPPTTPTSAADLDQLKKVQVVVAAAGKHVDRQLKELRHQLKDLREELRARPSGGQCEEAQVGDERWPGRTLGDTSHALSDGASDVGSVGGGSVASTFAGLGLEEKAELQKVRAVVGAASTVFSSQLRKLTAQVRELRQDLSTVKAQLSDATMDMDAYAQ